MAATINSNSASLNAQRNLNASQGSLNTALQRLSSGLRVNSAKDDAAGLAIATRMTAQSRGMTVAIRNANDGISLAQTAESAIGQMKEHLLRMRDLAIQSSNATNTCGDRDQLNTEFQQLQAEVQRIVQQTKFNGMAILSAGAGSQNFQVGAAVGDTVTITTTDLSLASGVAAAYTTSASSIASAAVCAQAAMSTIDSALDSLNTERSKYGAAQSRFEGITSMLSAARENQEAAIGRIMDADFAQETASLSRSQILQQAGTAMLAQANSVPQNVLSLLR